MSQKQDKNIILKKKKFGYKLKAYRERVGITQKKLAKLCGVSRVFISNIETGKKTPGRDLAKKLARHTDWDVVDLFNTLDLKILGELTNSYTLTRAKNEFGQILLDTENEADFLMWALGIRYSYGVGRAQKYKQSTGIASDKAKLSSAIIKLLNSNQVGTEQVVRKISDEFVQAFLFKSIVEEQQSLEFWEKLFKELKRKNSNFFNELTFILMKLWVDDRNFIKNYENLKEEKPAIYNDLKYAMNETEKRKKISKFPF